MKHKFLIVALSVICLSATDDEEIRALTKGINKGNAPSYYYSNRATLYMGKNKIDLAIKDLKTAIKKNPRASLYKAELADAYLLKHDFDSAMKMINLAIKQDDATYTFYLIKAVCNDLQHKRFEAMKNYSIYIDNLSMNSQIFSYYCFAHKRRAYMYYKLKQYSKSMKDVFFYLKHKGTDIDILLIKIFNQTKQGIYDDIYEDLNQVISLGFSDKNLLGRNGVLKVLSKEQLKKINLRIKKIKKYSLDSPERILKEFR